MDIKINGKMTKNLNNLVFSILQKFQLPTICPSRTPREIKKMLVLNLFNLYKSIKI